LKEKRVYGLCSDLVNETERDLYYKGKKVEPHTGPSSDFHGYGPKIRAEFKKRIPKKKDMKVLDVGTGFGSVLTFLVKNLPKTSKVWTVDPSEEILGNVKKKLTEEGLDSRIPIEFVQADASKLNFDDNYFDVVVSAMVLHHLSDLEAVLKELVRVVKKGGKIMLADYVPKAGSSLEFQKRHHESDFFEPKDVKKLIKDMGVSRATVKNVKLWYLADATK
jgi:ubiquinone/menaquinone biosynthesis C-methylase UbiE